MNVFSTSLYGISREFDSHMANNMRVSFIAVRDFIFYLKVLKNARL